MPGNNAQIEGGGESLDARRRAAAALTARRKAAARVRAADQQNARAAERTPSSPGSYRARRGDSIWSISEKTKPAGVSSSEWFGKVKAMNSTNGKPNRVYLNSGIKIPGGGNLSGDKGYSPKDKPGPGAPKAK